VPAETSDGQFAPEGAAPAEVPLRPVLPPLPKAWSPRDLVLFLFVSALLLVIVSPLLTYTAYAVLRPLASWRTPVGALANNPYFLLVVQSTFYVLLLGYVYFLVAVNYRQPFWTALAWRKPTTRQVVLFFLGGILLCLAVQLAPPLLPDVEDFPLLRLFTSPQAAYAIAAFAILVAPLMEELIFRGVLFRFFECQVGVRLAIAGTAVLFAGMHVPQYWRAWNHVLLICLVGVVFSLARGLTGSLVPSVILHIAYNTGLMIAFFFQTHQFRALGYFVFPWR
jgi:membrane protease YdiL (CAAX protease family)